MATPAQPEHLGGLMTDPYGTYAHLRESAPVRRIAGPDGTPAWLVTRYADVRAALADQRLSVDKRHALPGSYRGFKLPPALDANMLNMDPPDHTRIRRLVVKAFTKHRVESLREPVRRTADTLLDAIEAERPGTGEGRADLVAAYAAPLPITTICDLLGVPADHRRDFTDWTDALIAPDPARPDRAKETVVAMLGFYTALIADKRKEPGEDLLSDLIVARDDGDRLSEDELTSLAFLLHFAGYENAVQLIGNAALALLRHPGQLAALRADPARLPGAVEEFMRYDTSAVFSIRRFAREDLTLGGVTVPAGETVFLGLGSAGRDPERFPDPDRLDLDRDASGHLALGHGIHHCVGAPLARLELTTAIGALLERFPNLALGVPEGELRWRPSMRARGLLALPVVF
ncbi:cytochrome P450 family protein [Streptomyces flavofungini]|uniref:Cytochrome P450 n=1 Tax=Streptomyces flavofungini TaxID=68200 RepID=A0ABS0X340_9ACTN|nr:cytochrome P450 [Streptomyces flavofungini]MBJ3807599.1 cytochrome P450 [Streptomyces flavofungini]GHC64551.1 cytochrome P450 [Streptomyces flavofungini]